MRSRVRGGAYASLSRWVKERYGLSVRDCILKRINDDGLTHTALAEEFGIRRERLYSYARANGIDLATKPVAIDVWAQMACVPAEHCDSEGAGDE